MRPEDSQQEPKRHIPEFIYVEPEVEDDRKGFRREEEYQSIHSLQSQRFPFGMRILFLFLSCLLLFFLIIVAPIVLLLTGFNLLTMRKIENFNKNTIQLWGAFKKMVVVALGLLVAIFSPAFGISIIMIYFMMHKDNFGKVWMERIMKPSFRK